jgi:Spx/MgsR family transcriptional regulator
MIQIYGIKSCGSVRKALAFFKEHNIESNLVDFKKQSVGCEKISHWLGHVEMGTLLNTKGTTYKTLKLKELNLNDTAKKEWLCKENMLIKRPVIEFNNQVIVGFDEDVYKKVFL